MDLKSRADGLRALYSRNRGELEASLRLWLSAIEGTRKYLVEVDAIGDPKERGAKLQVASFELLAIAERCGRDFVLSELGEAAERLEVMRHATEG